MATLNSFFKPKSQAVQLEYIHWKTTRGTPGTTARHEIHLKARPGSFVNYTLHGKVKLVSQPAPDKLEIEIEEVNLSTFRAHGCAFCKFYTRFLCFMGLALSESFSAFSKRTYTANGRGPEF